MARSMGAVGVTVTRPSELRDQIAAALESSEPHVLDVRVVPRLRRWQPRPGSYHRCRTRTDVRMAGGRCLRRRILGRRPPTLLSADEVRCCRRRWWQRGVMRCTRSPPLGRIVLLLERAPREWRGGNSKYTRNLRCVSDSRMHPGAAYSPQEFFDDLERVADGEPFERELADLLVRDSAAAVGWMEKLGVRFGNQPLRGRPTRAHEPLFSRRRQSAREPLLRSRRKDSESRSSTTRRWLAFAFVASPAPLSWPARTPRSSRSGPVRSWSPPVASRPIGNG